jgi:hypothetical protein
VKEGRGKAGNNHQHWCKLKDNCFKYKNRLSTNPNLFESGGVKIHSGFGDGRKMTAAEKKAFAPLLLENANNYNYFGGSDSENETSSSSSSGTGSGGSISSGGVRIVATAAVTMRVTKIRGSNEDLIHKESS